MDSRKQFEDAVMNSSENHGMLRDLSKDSSGEYRSACERSAWWAWQASRESMVMDIRQAAKKWFYESFDDELLEEMQNHGLIAQTEGFSISVMAELELEMESAMNSNGIRTK